MDETTAHDTGDDYSYDMAHDVPGLGEQPAASRERRASAPERPARPDEVGDYSYDLAHEVPPARRRDA